MRMNYADAAPEALAAMKAFQHYVTQSGLDPQLVHLVDVRVSQINGCAY